MHKNDYDSYKRSTNKSTISKNSDMNYESNSNYYGDSRRKGDNIQNNNHY